jgi:glucan endo-1,3-alpha-glucosidase
MPFGNNIKIGNKSTTIVSSNEASAKIFHEGGKGFMSGITASYWGAKQNRRRYYEYYGGEGLQAQWQSVIEYQKPEWVELITWNDWSEGSYFSPVDDINKYWPYSFTKRLGFFKLHRGYYNLSKYYIQWYKSGRKPEIKEDKLFFFYRTQPLNSVAQRDSLGGVKEIHGDVKDVIYVTTLLKSPAKLTVVTGGKFYSYNLNGGGTENVRVPFNVGKQLFEINRNGKRIISAQGEDIKANIEVYNFNVYSDEAGAEYGN